MTWAVCLKRFERGSAVGRNACGSAECDGLHSHKIEQPSAAAQGGTACVPPYELNVPQHLFARLGERAWQFNQAFLDRVISRGDVIRFSSDPRLAPAGSFTARELQYLNSRGYVYSPISKTMTKQ
jgi:hypothetical protein